MPINDPIESSLYQKFQSEKLARAIKECDDINIVKDIAMHLLNLNQQKSAIANWSTRRAAEAEMANFTQELNIKNVDI